MTPTIQKLYNGELHPSMHIPKSTAYQDSRRAYEQELLDIQTNMPQAAPKLKDAIDCYTLTSEIAKDEMFQYGFSLGLRLMAEALTQ